MKKSILLFLSLAIILLIVTGCGNPFKKDQQKPQEPTSGEKTSDVFDSPSSQSAQSFSIDIPDKSFNQNLKITGKTAPDYRVFINEKEYFIDSVGSFTADFTLTPGNNLFTFKAVSSDNKSIFTTSKTVEYETKPKLEITLLDQTTENALNIEGITDPKSIVNANGNKAQADENGKFKITLSSDGINTIKIMSTNMAGKTTIVQKTIN